MVEEDNLGVLFALDLLPSAHPVLLSLVQVRIHIDDLSVPSISEEQARVAIGIDLEIRGVIVLDLLALPAVVAQIAGLGVDLLPL